MLLILECASVFFKKGDISLTTEIHEVVDLYYFACAQPPILRGGPVKATA